VADFRLERLFVMLDEPIAGLDHMRAVDPVELAWHGSNALAEQAGLVPLDEFTFAPFERPRWRQASVGLKTVRGLCAIYRAWLASGQNPYGYGADVVRSKLSVMDQLEAVLAEADSAGRRFYLGARDLAEPSAAADRGGM
jgi:hypothetical protein